MSGRLRTLVLLTAVLAALTTSLRAFAIQKETAGELTGLVGIGFGARALGMGGAFVAVADDATAVLWNPAGLAQLERPEVSLVASTINALRMYDLQMYDGTMNIVNQRVAREGWGVDFASFVRPSRKGNRKSVWALSYSQDGVERHRESRFIQLARQTLDLRADMKFNSLSLTYAWGTDHQMLGVNLIEQRSQLSRHQVRTNEDGTVAGRFDYDATDSELSWQLGWLYKTQDVAFGATYRAPGFQDATRVKEFPETWAIGASFRPRDMFRWAVAYRRIAALQSELFEPYPVDSYHVGAEWLLPKKGRLIPIRAGFYTRVPGATGVEAIKAFTVGSGLATERNSVDVAFEFGTGGFRRLTLSAVHQF